MTKKDIALRIAKETKFKQINVRKIIQKTLDSIIDSLAKGEKVELRNFGVFKIKSRRGRTGRNPRTGQVIPVLPRKVVVFRPGMVMKQKVI